MLFIPSLLLLGAFVILYGYLARKRGLAYVISKLSLVLFLLFTLLSIWFYLSYTKESIKESESRVLVTVQTQSEQLLVLDNSSGLSDRFLMMTLVGDEFAQINNSTERAKMVDYLETTTYRMLNFAGLFLAIYALSSLMAEKTRENPTSK